MQEKLHELQAPGRAIYLVNLIADINIALDRLPDKTQR